MNKKLKICLIIVGIIIAIIILKVLTTKPLEQRLAKYLTNIDFVQDEGSALYYKQTSKLSRDEYLAKISAREQAHYEALYFNTASYDLTEDELDYQDDIEISFNPTYNYQNQKITYTYRINVNNTNALIEGTYDQKSEIFTCEPTFAFNIEIDQSINDICDSIKLEVEDFQDTATTLITNYRLLEEMQKAK